jgi:hypothetical protein
VPRRVSLPGADELFRTTGGAALQAPQPRQRTATNGEAQQAAPADPRLRPAPTDGESQAQDGDPEPRSGAERGGDPAEHGGRDTPSPRRPLNGERAGGPPTAGVTPSSSPSQPPPITATPQPQAARRKAQRQNRRPSGRERHDEKITVYVSAEELMDLEHARLVLRGEHGLAIDRGRIVREAVAVVLADLESRGDASILVRRLRGR